ncbi:hypothetical protein SBA1_50065 [Candidatus Sulfotelmatobacter kueseliae]|uniref:Uncharacterized protein n=1 Tax=Candidatus Sulfotelmatobacter kueseliae TaxID=2042962 RepID=A0A2U3KVA6_9BACT|nr:hypothetical protein SBA1_50065 [Candidatus Sulfotelmatobacter kueseliae]
MLRLDSGIPPLRDRERAQRKPVPLHLHPGEHRNLREFEAARAAVLAPRYCPKTWVNPPEGVAPAVRDCYHSAYAVGREQHCRQAVPSQRESA